MNKFIYFTAASVLALGFGISSSMAAEGNAGGVTNVGTTGGNVDTTHHTCPPGYVWNPTTHMCVPVPGTVTTLADMKKLNVQVEIEDSCSITHLDNITFSPLQAGVPVVQQQTTGTVTVYCPGQANAQLFADAGLHSAAAGGTLNDCTTRHMGNVTGTPNTDFLAYHLYTDAAHTTEWGGTAPGTCINGTPSTVTATIPVAGLTPVTATIYADLPATTTGPAVAGNYRDEVTVSLYY